MDEKVLQRVAGDVAYEINMVKFTARKMTELSLENNAALESFLLHVRNLQEFFHKDPNNLANYERDLIVAENYLQDIPKWRGDRPRMEHIHEMETKIHQHLAHISSGRAEQGKINWEVGRILTEILNVWDFFLSKLSVAKKDWFLKP